MTNHPTPTPPEADVQALAEVCGNYVRLYLPMRTIVAECAKEAGHQGLHESVVGTKWEVQE